jgi:hypothetical protein
VLASGSGLATKRLPAQGLGVVEASSRCEVVTELSGSLVRRPMRSIDRPNSVGRPQDRGTSPVSISSRSVTAFPQHEAPSALGKGHSSLVASSECQPDPRRTRFRASRRRERPGHPRHTECPDCARPARPFRRTDRRSPVEVAQRHAVLRVVQREVLAGRLTHLRHHAPVPFRACYAYLFAWP